MKGKIRRLTAWVTNNFGLKLLAVIVSVGLWFVVNNITDPVEKVKFNNVTVEIINDDAITNSGKVYEVLDNTNNVTVEVSGKRSVLSYITKDNIKATADMEDLTILNTVAIEVSSTRSNSDLEFKTSIDSVKLSIEDMKRTQMRITTSTSGDPAEGYIVGSVSPSQNIVQISGPESVIDQIDRVEAVADIDGYNSDISTSVDLKLYDAEGAEIKSSSIKMNISSVNVSVTILATKEVPLVFTVSGEPADGYIANGSITSSSASVTLAGRKSVLDAVPQMTVSDAFSLEGASEDVTETVNIKPYLPSGTQLADSSYNGYVSVTAGVERLVTKDITVPEENFAIGFEAHALPEGLEAQIKELESADAVKIRISGTQAAVSAVDADDVIGVVAMDRVFENLELEEWTAGSYVGEVVFDFHLDGGLTVETDMTYSLTVVIKEIQEDGSGSDE